MQTFKYKKIINSPIIKSRLHIFLNKFNRNKIYVYNILTRNRLNKFMIKWL